MSWLSITRHASPFVAWFFCPCCASMACVCIPMPPSIHAHIRKNQLSQLSCLQTLRVCFLTQAARSKQKLWYSHPLEVMSSASEIRCYENASSTFIPNVPKKSAQPVSSGGPQTEREIKKQQNPCRLGIPKVGRNQKGYITPTILLAKALPCCALPCRTLHSHTNRQNRKPHCTTSPLISWDSSLKERCTAHIACLHVLHHMPLFWAVGSVFVSVLYVSV